MFSQGVFVVSVVSSETLQTGSTSPLILLNLEREDGRIVHVEKVVGPRLETCD